MFWSIENLFEKAMSVKEPWYIEKTEFKTENQKDFTDWEMHIWINFRKWARFLDEDSWKELGVYDTKQKTYRHLNFFQYPTFIHIRVPRIKTDEWKIKTILMDFIRNNSGFTLLMEAFILQLVKSWMSVLKVWKLLWETDKKLWNMLLIYGVKWREYIDFKEVKKIWVDETSSKKWHNYIAPVVDLNMKDIIFIWDWKKADVIAQFVRDLFLHNWDSENIREVSIDFSPSFVSWVKKYLCKANIVYDKFHFMKMMNEVINKIRKKNSKWNKELKKTKLLFLMNEINLKDKQKTKLNKLLSNNIELLESYTFRLFLQEFYQQINIKDAEEILDIITELMAESKIDELNKFWKNIVKNKKWILNYWINKTTNAILEWMNSQIQTIKRIAKWFRNVTYFKSIIYIRLWRLNLAHINPIL